MTRTIDDKVTIAAATVVLLVAMYFFSWPGLIATFALLLVLMMAYNMLWIRPRVNAANALLYEDGDPEAFLQAMDALLQGRILPAGSATKMRDILTVNRTAGLFYAGRWSEALDALDALDAARLPALFRRLHFNNRLACLIALEDAEGARRLVADNPSLLEPPPGQPDIALALRGNRAGLARLSGERTRSRAMLEEILTELERDGDARRELPLAFAHYQLGRLDLDERRIDDAKAHLAEAVRRAPKTFLPKVVESLLANA